MNLSSERRWQVRKLIICVNLLLLGLAFYADSSGLKLDAFVWASAGFQGASASWFIADYATKPED